MVDCIFCKIVEGKIPSTKIFENESVVGFKDLRPQSKEHYLFIHRRHTANINEMADSNPNQLADVFKAISDFTKSDGLIKNGFRVVTNQGPHAGQTVFHTHFHVLGGEPLGHFGS